MTSGWKGFVTVVAVAALVGRASYEVILGGGAHAMLTWCAGLFAVVLVYAVVGLVMAWRLEAGEILSADSTSTFTAVASLFRPVRWPWQLLRLGLSVYAGALTAALMSNALMDPRTAEALAVLAGLATAMFGLFLVLRPTRP